MGLSTLLQPRMVLSAKFHRNWLSCFPYSWGRSLFVRQTNIQMQIDRYSQTEFETTSTVVSLQSTSFFITGWMIDYQWTGLDVSERRWLCYTDNNESSSSSSSVRVAAAADTAQSTFTARSRDVAADGDGSDAVIGCCWQSELTAEHFNLNSLTPWQFSTVSTFSNWLLCALVWCNLSNAAALNASISDFCHTDTYFHYRNSWDHNCICIL